MSRDMKPEHELDANTVAEANERWVDAGRVLRHRCPEVFDRMLELAEAQAAAHLADLEATRAEPAATGGV